MLSSKIGIKIGSTGTFYTGSDELYIFDNWQRENRGVGGQEPLRPLVVLCTNERKSK